jgi:hypothetical protein
MSAISDCGGCMNGDHSKHSGAHRGRRSVLGGYHCGCQGDCAERHAEAVERLFGPIRDALAKAEAESV